MAAAKDESASATGASELKEKAQIFDFFGGSEGTGGLAGLALGKNTG